MQTKFGYTYPKGTAQRMQMRIMPRICDEGVIHGERTGNENIHESRTRRNSFVVSIRKYKPLVRRFLVWNFSIRVFIAGREMKTKWSR